MQKTLLRAHPERAAWIVVWSAFAVFCLLVVCVPLAVRYVLRYSTVSRPATLQTLEGTVRVVNPDTGRLDAVTKDQTATVGEGYVIYLDDKAKADLRFFDGTLLRILPDSGLTVQRVRAPRFAAGVTPDTIWLHMTEGAVEILTGSPLRRAGLDLNLRLQDLDAEISIAGDGQYGVELQPEGANITARQGSVVVTAKGRSVRLLASAGVPERTTIQPGHPPSPPIASARSFVQNGDFSEPLSQGWTIWNEPAGAVPGRAIPISSEGFPAVSFYRSDGNRNHGQTIMEQVINRDLPPAVSSLVVRASMKVIYQSLPGGGYLASEYPLMIRLKYRDMYGNENEWVQGFYYGDPQGNPTHNGVQVTREGWEAFASQNLLDTRFLQPTPSRIISLRVYASGWDYESMIRSISLEVQ